MDSRLLYAAINSLKHTIDWNLNSESEWMHIGIGNELKKETLLEKISHLFNKDKIFIVKGRESSREIKVVDFEQKLFSEIGKIDFILCNEKLSKFIEFNKIGVFRIGKK